MSRSAAAAAREDESELGNSKLFTSEACNHLGEVDRSYKEIVSSVSREAVKDSVGLD